MNRDIYSLPDIPSVLDALAELFGAEATASVAEEVEKLDGDWSDIESQLITESSQ